MQDVKLQQQECEILVNGFLEELSMGTLGNISDAILAHTNKEKDPRDISLIARLIYQKARDEPKLCSRLAKILMDRISPDIRDDDIQDHNGKFVSGGRLFRRSLIIRCQEGFERGRNTTGAESSAEDVDLGATLRDLPCMRLGQIQFLGELYKIQILTERTMHECITKLLAPGADAEEEDIENVCTLMEIVGQSLDQTRTRARMDFYFRRIELVSRCGNVSSRMVSMLQVCGHYCNSVERNLISTSCLESPRTSRAHVDP